MGIKFSQSAKGSTYTDRHNGRVWESW